MQLLLHPASHSQMPCLIRAQKPCSKPISAGKPLHLSAWPDSLLFPNFHGGLHHCLFLCCQHIQILASGGQFRIFFPPWILPFRAQMWKNRHCYREANGNAQEWEDKVHVLLQKVLDLLQAILGRGKQQQFGAGFIPTTALPQPERIGGKKGVQHCTAGQFSLFCCCCSLGRQTSVVYFSVTTTRPWFYWHDAFYTVGDVCLSVVMQKLFSLHPMKNGKKKMERWKSRAHCGAKCIPQGY